MGYTQSKKNKESIKEWVEQFTSDLLSWASHKVSDPELAKDLVQDTFLAATEKVESFRAESSAKTWLFSILNYKIIDHYRNKSKKMFASNNESLHDFFNEDGDWNQDKMPEEWNEENEELLDNDHFNQMLNKCLDALPEKWSSSIKLKYLLSKKGEEICQELGITNTNYWQMMHRAKLQLRDCLGNNWFKEN